MREISWYHSSLQVGEMERNMKYHEISQNIMKYHKNLLKPTWHAGAMVHLQEAEARFPSPTLHAGRHDLIQIIQDHPGRWIGCKSYGKLNNKPQEGEGEPGNTWMTWMTFIDMEADEVPW